MTWQVLEGDAGDRLRELPPSSVQCVVTSPPYWGLRDYGVAGQLGLEPTPDQHVRALVAVFAEVWRVLRPDGTVWLNLGDSYTSGKMGRADGDRHGVDGFTGGRKFENTAFRQRLVPDGAKPKDLVGIPWRVAFALQAAGWYLRSDIIWAKPNPMPESVTDRPTKAHEYLFLLTKRERYYYDAAAVLEPYTETTVERMNYSAIPRNGKSILNVMTGGEGNRLASGVTRTTAGLVSHEARDNGGRNKRSVWTIPTEPYPKAHFATFPTALVEPCVLAGSRPGDTVLDPFCGSGTVGAVAIGLGRSFVGIDLNPAYIELARARIGAVAPLFVSETRHTTSCFPTSFEVEKQEVTEAETPTPSRGESAEPDRQAKLFDFVPETVGVG